MRQRRRASPSLSSSSTSMLLLRAALLLLVFNVVVVEGSFRLCGFRLTMTLTAICKNQICGGYVAPPAKRRSHDSELIGQEDEDKFSVDDAETDPFELGDSYYEESMPRERRSYGGVAKRAGGIATECCEKRCTLSYLKTFCCAALQLPNSGASGGGITATAKSGGSSKPSVAALLKKKTTTRLPAMAFVSEGGADASGGDETVDDLLVIR